MLYTKYNKTKTEKHVMMSCMLFGMSVACICVHLRQCKVNNPFYVQNERWFSYLIENQIDNVYNYAKLDPEKTFNLKSSFRYTCIMKVKNNRINSIMLSLFY